MPHLIQFISGFGRRDPSPHGVAYSEPPDVANAEVVRWELNVCNLVRFSKTKKVTLNCLQSVPHGIMFWFCICFFFFNFCFFLRFSIFTNNLIMYNDSLSYISLDSSGSQCSRRNPALVGFPSLGWKLLEQYCIKTMASS